MRWVFFLISIDGEDMETRSGSWRKVKSSTMTNLLAIISRVFILVGRVGIAVNFP